MHNEYHTNIHQETIIPKPDKRNNWFHFNSIYLYLDKLLCCPTPKQRVVLFRKLGVSTPVFQSQLNVTNTLINVIIINWLHRDTPTELFNSPLSHTLLKPHLNPGRKKHLAQPEKSFNLFYLSFYFLFRQVHLTVSLMADPE